MSGLCIFVLLVLWTHAVVCDTSISGLHQVNATIGSNVSLSCLSFMSSTLEAEVKASSDCDMTWMMDPSHEDLHAVIFHNEEQEQRHSTNSLYLGINGVQQLAEGVYNMNVSCPSRNIRYICSIQLHVYSIPVLTFPVDTSVQVAGHAPFEIPCHVESSYPTATVHWRHNGQIVRSGGEFVITPLGLQVEHATQQTAGFYECQANNGYALSDSGHMEVKVTGLQFDKRVPPQLLFEIGTSATVSCGAHLNNESYPTTWFMQHPSPHEKRIIPKPLMQKDGELRLMNVSISDEGRYVCSAANGSKTITMATNITVFAHLQLTQQSSSKQLVHENNKTVLSCSVLGWPVPRIEWSRDNISLTGVMESAQTDGLMHNSFLTIKHAGYHDSGWYTCTAQNGIESRKQTTNLQVTGVPGHPSVTIHSGWDQTEFPARLHATVNWNITFDGGSPLTSVSLIILDAHVNPRDKSKWPKQTTYPPHQHKIVVHHLMPATSYTLILWASNKHGAGHVTIATLKTAAHAVLGAEETSSGQEKDLLVILFVGVCVGLLVLIFMIIAVVKYCAKRDSHVDYLLQSRSRSDSEGSETFTKISDAQLVWQFENPLYNNENMSDIGATNVLSLPPTPADGAADLSMSASSPGPSVTYNNLLAFCPESPINNNAY